MNFPNLNNENGIDSKHFVKLKNDKDSIVGVFRGDPYNFRQHWINKRSQICTGNTCALCADKQKSVFRFRLNFITKESDGTYIAKIFEQAFTVYQQLKALHEGEYQLDKTIVRITRNGTGMSDTTYSILPIRDCVVSEELNRKFSDIKLHDLMNLSPEASDEESKNASNDIPF